MGPPLHLVHFVEVDFDLFGGSGGSGGFAGGGEGGEGPG